MTRRRSQSSAYRITNGFTLIELLVALVIIGIVVSLAVLAIGDNRLERAREVATQVMALSDLAREQAIFNGADYALNVWREGYQFHQLQNGRWTPLAGDAEFRARSLPEGLSFTLYLEGLEAELPWAPKDQPQVFILSSGEITPFELRIKDEEETLAVLAGDALGNLALNLAAQSP